MKPAASARWADLVTPVPGPRLFSPRQQRANDWAQHRRTRPLDALDDAGNRLAEADAHRGDAVARVATLELGNERRGDAGAGRPERMPERDAAPVRIHIAGLVALAEASVGEELQDDRRECLVHLDHFDVVPRQSRLRERAIAGLRVAVQHQMRVDAREAEAEEAGARAQAELGRLLLGCDENRGRAVDDLAPVPRGDLALADEHRLETL